MRGTQESVLLSAPAATLKKSYKRAACLLFSLWCIYFRGNKPFKGARHNVSAFINQ
jgi:hypothetical protein